jgi:2,5-diketo-D-gluconate reductase A
MSEPPTIAKESVELASGAKMPMLGLGTWQLRGSSVVNSVLRALEVGYRHIDTATVYGNEKQVGQAVAKSGLRRQEIFLTTKLPPRRAGQERETLEASLDALGFGYVDLWLVHWPPSGGARPDVWERLLELQAEGLTRDVGVSNYSISQIAESHSVTTAQVVLRWHIEHRIVAIPRSANAERIAENADIFGFALTGSEVESLDSFASGGQRARW